MIKPTDTATFVYVDTKGNELPFKSTNRPKNKFWVWSKRDMGDRWAYMKLELGEFPCCMIIKKNKARTYG